MEKRINQSLVFCLLISLLTTACNKGNSVVTASNVYVAGSTAYSAVLWNNNQANYLTVDSASSANCIYVNGSDVYIGGAIFLNGLGNIPVYWKNGNANYLSLSLPDSNNSTGIVNSIFVSGSDVYAAGTAGYQISDSTTYAVIWKDGIMNILDSIPLLYTLYYFPCSVNSLYVSGNNVYAAGYGHSGACYWQNGNATSVATDANTVANSIFVSGSDVYVAGQQTDSNASAARYWKNGTVENLTVAANSNSICRSIYISGNDVYVCGNQTINNTTVATYWKNGTPVNLGTGIGNSDAYSIFVKGSAVFVAGTANGAACYWNNGKEIQLALTAVASAVFVQ